MSGSCVTPAADCGVRRVLSRRRNSTQLGDQPKNGRGTSLSITAPTAQAVRSATGRGVHYPGFTEGPAERLLVQREFKNLTAYIPTAVHQNFLESLTSSFLECSSMVLMPVLTGTSRVLKCSESESGLTRHTCLRCDGTVKDVGCPY